MTFNFPINDQFYLNFSEVKNLCLYFKNVIWTVLFCKKNVREK